MKTVCIDMPLYHILFLHKHHNLITKTIITNIKINIYEKKLYGFSRN